ncbi:VOC family protein [Pleionea sp. CnH1-48]|uniref:VOC family protein n=1 Tax=Pleionea sp. CnH1-48 TaxID=2954494 RepID=UPI0020973DA5|nr:VOC family protein [Pleionea sp. CnH1-48]MCO7226677.1 VOC family protein [Pleionea sp. CnH1-48]
MSGSGLTGLSHITLSTQQLDHSFQFYTQQLGFTPRARWDQGAYLVLGDLWLCLSLDEHRQSNQKEYTHIAFSIDRNHFDALAKQLIDADIPQWKQNSSEGQSLYILDPDEHKLEIHVGDLDSRLAAIAKKPYQGLELF